LRDSAQRGWLRGQIGASRALKSIESVTGKPDAHACGGPTVWSGGGDKGAAMRRGDERGRAQEDVRYRNDGIASWYGEDFHGRLTANGEVYDMNAISAAHPTLPMPCYVRVTNLANRRSLIVRINDRGPYHANREIDLSGKAAELLGFAGRGLARVRVEYVGRAPLEGSDDRRLIATLREGEPAPVPSGVMIASARPFVPQVQGRRSPLLRGTVPVPEDRPFDLGERQTMQDAALAASPRTAAADPHNPFAAMPQSPSPATAYAPARFDNSLSVTTGRGLY
jgi:rare lipoprotein A